jgi:adenosylmethionine---8-amino-7-oxononanoate aminotransferase
VLLIFDEIFTGFGRTGSLFACEQAGIVPDILCLSKALTGGTMALAATIARTEVFAAFWSEDPAAALMHGPTFMANPLACAAANASLDLFETEPRLTQAQAIGKKLADGLEPLRRVPGIADVRVLGAIGAVQFAEAPDLAALKARLLDRGVWVRPFGDIVYLTPALTIGAADLDRLIEAVSAAVAEGASAAG